MWPWGSRVAEEERRLAETEEKQRAAEQLVQKSRQITAELRREVRKNHFTELLQEAWGGRAT